MGGCTCRENGPQATIRRKLRNRLRYALYRGRDKNACLVGEYGVGHATDVGGDARQAGGSGLQIDQSKSLHPAG